VSSGATELEKLEALYADWSRGDFSRGDMFDPEMETETFGMGEPMRADTYDGFVEAMRDWLRAWERPLKVEAEEFVTSGDRILALIHWSGRGKGSGVPLEARGAHLWTFREGRAVRIEVYRDRDEARAAFEAG
jgi:ketosteroid isomerase-like protein